MVRCVSAEPYFGNGVFPLLESCQDLKTLQYPFPLRAPSVAKAYVPPLYHSTSFSDLWIYQDASLCFLVTLNWSPLCLGNQQQ